MIYSFFSQLLVMLKSFLKKPGFPLIIVFTLSLALAALTIAFNINYHLLLKPLPYPKQSQLVVPLVDYSKSNENTVSSKPRAAPVPMLLHSYRNQKVFDSMALIRGREKSILLNHQEQPSLNITYTTHEYGELLGIDMLRGRYFNESEKLGSKRNVGVIGYDAWKTYFSTDDKIIGKLIDLDGRVFQVIGVVDKSFIPPDGKERDVDVWLPWDFADFRGNRFNNWTAFSGDVWGIGRLRQDLGLSNLSDNFNKMVLSEFSRHESNFVKYDAQLTPLRAHLLGNTNYVAIAFLIAAFLLLGIAFMNLLNMFYSRIVEKENTLAIQAVLGAKRRDLKKSTLFESMTLALISAFISFVVSHFGYKILMKHGDGYFKRLEELNFNIPTFVAVLTISLFIGYMFSFFCVRNIKYDILIKHLNGGLKGNSIQISKSSRSKIVLFQVSLATLIIGGLSISIAKSLNTIYQPLGLTPQDVYSAEIYYKLKPKMDEGKGSIDLEKNRSLMINIKKKIDESKIVHSSSIASSDVFFLYAGLGVGMRTLDNIKLGKAMLNRVSEDYFDTLNISILAGRAFNSEEFRQNSKLAVLSGSAASLFPKGVEAVGSTIKIGREKYKVIGVANDVYQPETQVRESVIYAPYRPEPFFAKTQILINAPHSERSHLNRVVTEAVKSFDPKLSVKLESLEHQYNTKTYNVRLLAQVAIVFSILTLFLFIVGLYGVIKFGIGVRKYEMGIRIALGAKKIHIIYLVIKETLRTVSFGLLISSIPVFTLWFIFSFFDNDVANINIGSFLWAIPTIFVFSILSSTIPLIGILNQDAWKMLREN